jgi:hypothetical protein
MRLDLINVIMNSIPYTTFYGVGLLRWENNLLDGVSLTLLPGHYGYDGESVNVDLAVTLRNNLFRNVFFWAVTQPASAGNWLVADNWFERTEFYQDPTYPLDFDYNGYQPAAYPLYYGTTGQLQSTNPVNGQHEVILSYPLPYTNAAYGNYYLTTLTPLYQGGSRTAGAAGLSEYTTFADQFKDPSNAPVSIGLLFSWAKGSTVSF